MKKTTKKNQSKVGIATAIIAFIILIWGLWVITPKVGDPDYVPPAEGSHTQTVTEYISDFC